MKLILYNLIDFDQALFPKGHVHWIGMILQRKPGGGGAVDVTSWSDQSPVDFGNPVIYF